MAPFARTKTPHPFTKPRVLAQRETPEVKEARELKRKVEDGELVPVAVVSAAVRAVEANEPQRREPSRSAKRRETGLGAVYPLAEAVALLPMSDADARRWLREQGLVANIDGRDVVAWHRVTEALYDDDGEPQAPTPPPARRKRGRAAKPLPRVRLGRNRE